MLLCNGKVTGIVNTFCVNISMSLRIRPAVKLKNYIDFPALGMAYTIWDVDDYCIVANFGEGLIW